MKSLPPAPPGKAGWPWTESSVPLPPVMPDGAPWPTVSIVTPSYNQAWALEETLRSVLLQGYPNLEYIVMDGGSTDNSVEIIKKYASWLTFWQTAPDQGQTQALNQGFGRATGDVFGWMNSDDIFLPNALRELMLLRMRFPRHVGWVGAAREIDKDGNPMRVQYPELYGKREMFKWGPMTPGGSHFYQPACLFDAETFKKVGGLDEFMWCSMDMDLWIRMRDAGNYALTRSIVAAPRIYEGTKSGQLTAKNLIDAIIIGYKHGSRKFAEEKLHDYEKQTEAAVDVGFWRRWTIGADGGFIDNILSDYLDCAKTNSAFTVASLNAYLAVARCRRTGGLFDRTDNNYRARFEVEELIKQRSGACLWVSHDYVSAIRLAMLWIRIAPWRVSPYIYLFRAVGKRFLAGRGHGPRMRRRKQTHNS